MLSACSKQLRYFARDVIMKSVSWAASNGRWISGRKVLGYSAILAVKDMHVSEILLALLYGGSLE